MRKEQNTSGGEARGGASVQLLVNPLVFQPDLLKFRSGGLPVGHPLLQRTLHLDKLAVHGGEIDLAVAGKLFDQLRLALLERFELLLQIGNLLFGRLFPRGQRVARLRPGTAAVAGEIGGTDLHLLLRRIGQTRRTQFGRLLEIVVVIAEILADARRLHGRGPYKDHLWFCVERPAEDWTTRPTFWFELGPDYWGYGMGCWMARPMDMAKLRARIVRDPKPMEKLTKALRGQTEFTLGGDTYKRPKAGAPSELLAPWFQMKTISITHEEKLTEELFSRDVVDRIKTGYTFLLPYYDYFLTLPSDPEPETLK